MCLGVPGKVLSLRENSLGMTMGTVDFAGVSKEVCLAYLPEVQVGDYVLVHVGFALSRIDEQEAAEVFRFLDEMAELADIGIPRPASDTDGSASKSEAPSGGAKDGGPES